MLPGHAPAVTYGDPSPIQPCWWVRGEYLLWWVKDAPVPLPLVSTGPLNNGGGAVLYGNTTIAYDPLSGGQLTAGLWFDTHSVFGLEVGGFVLGNGPTRQAFTSNGTGSPPLGIPFFNVDRAMEDFADFATPGQTVGRLDISSSITLWGGNSTLVFNFVRSPCFAFDALVGFRYLGLREDFQIAGSTGALPGQQLAFGGALFGPPAVTKTFDRFATSNYFYGGQLGARGEWHCGALSFELAGKLALGNTHEDVNISGFSFLYLGPVGPTGSLLGGIFALPSNIGHHTGTDFTAVPELETKIAYQLGCHVRVSAGYDLTFWSRVARPGDQINRNLSQAQIPTFIEFGTPSAVRQPLPYVASTDFWAQGLTAGIEFQF
jgi:hypothetical protein